jgi:hypothetical protein
MAVCAFALVKAVYPPAAIRFLQSTVADCPGWDDSDADDPIRLPHERAPVAVGTAWGHEPSRIESDIAVSLGWLGVQHPQLLPVIASWATGEYDDALLRRIAVRALGVVARCDSPDGRNEVDICSTLTEIMDESDETSLRWLAAKQVRACIGEEAAPHLPDRTIDVLARTLAEATHRRREQASEETRRRTSSSSVPHVLYFWPALTRVHLPPPSGQFAIEPRASSSVVASTPLTPRC